jgi:hypothetical protein
MPSHLIPSLVASMVNTVARIQRNPTWPLSVPPPKKFANYEVNPFLRINLNYSCCQDMGKPYYVEKM